MFLINFGIISYTLFLTNIIPITMVGKRDGKTLIKKIFIELRTAFIIIFELSKIKISISIKKYKTLSSVK